MRAVLRVKAALPATEQSWLKPKSGKGFGLLVAARRGLKSMHNCTRGVTSEFMVTLTPVNLKVTMVHGIWALSTELPMRGEAQQLTV